MTLTEKERSNDWPEVTVVSTMGELLESPMSMYTEVQRGFKYNWAHGGLTVGASVGAADAGDGGAARHDEQVVVTLVVRGLGLRQHEVAEVQSESIVMEFRIPCPSREHVISTSAGRLHRSTC